MTRALSRLSSSRPPTHAARPLVSQRGERRLALGSSRKRGLTALGAELRADTFRHQTMQAAREAEERREAGDLEGCLEALERELVLKRDRFGLRSPQASDVIRRAGAVCNSLGRERQASGDLEDADIFLMKAEILNRGLPAQLAVTLNLMAAVSRARYMESLDEEELARAVARLKQALQLEERAQRDQQAAKLAPAPGAAAEPGFRTRKRGRRRAAGGARGRGARPAAGLPPRPRPGRGRIARGRRGRGRGGGRGDRRRLTTRRRCGSCARRRARTCSCASSWRCSGSIRWPRRTGSRP